MKSGETGGKLAEMIKKAIRDCEISDRTAFLSHCR